MEIVPCDFPLVQRWLKVIWNFLSPKIDSSNWEWYDRPEIVLHLLRGNLHSSRFLTVICEWRLDEKWDDLQIPLTGDHTGKRARGNQHAYVRIIVWLFPKLVHNHCNWRGNVNCLRKSENWLRKLWKIYRDLTAAIRWDRGARQKVNTIIEN
jgi:hypothetical protein